MSSARGRLHAVRDPQDPQTFARLVATQDIRTSEQFIEGAVINVKGTDHETRYEFWARQGRSTRPQVLAGLTPSTRNFLGHLLAEGHTTGKTQRLMDISRVRRNGFERFSEDAIRRGEAGAPYQIALFQNGSVVGHSCTPNVVLNIDWSKTRPQLSISAVEVIRRGQTITVDYLADVEPPFPSFAARAAMLGAWGIVCACSNCSTTGRHESDRRRLSILSMLNDNSQPKVLLGEGEGRIDATTCSQTDVDNVTQLLANIRREGIKDSRLALAYLALSDANCKATPTQIYMAATNAQRARQVLTTAYGQGVHNEEGTRQDHRINAVRARAIVWRRGLGHR